MRTGAGRLWLVRALGLVGAALLLASAGVHFDLYLTGYRNVPTIGALFLVQVASATVLSLAVASVVALGMRLPAALVGAAAAAFAFGTVAAYGVSRVTSLFGFHEHPTKAALVAGLLEVGAFVASAGFAGKSFGGRARRKDTAAPTDETREHGIGKSSRRVPVQALGLGAATAALLTVVVAGGIGSSAGRSPPHPSAAAGSARVVHVVISAYAFHPARVAARPGEVIEVTNEDQVTHTMTAVPGSVPFGGFNTGSVDAGATVMIRAPKSPGTYRFYCSIHIFMKGAVVVSQ